MLDFSNLPNRKHWSCLFFLLLILSSSHVKAQNLVANGDFESMNLCPVGGSNILPWPNFKFVQSWVRPTGASSDYYNRCATAYSSSVPVNWMGFQQPRSGNGYAGIYASIDTRQTGDSYREYISTKLLEPMKKDSTYCVAFYLNLAYMNGAGLQSKMRAVVGEVGAHFSDTLPGNTLNVDPLVLPYHIVSDSTIHMNDTAKWYRVEGEYKAKGGEEWMTIGTFGQAFPAYTYFFPGDTGNTICYYYIDDVSVVTKVQKDSVHRLALCTKTLTLSSAAGAGPYRWSTGDTTKSIQVSKPGNYLCNVAYECSAYNDSFIVEVMPVINTASQIRVCDTSKLDTVLMSSRTTGPYLWNTGATTRSIRVTTFGDYYCDVLVNCTNYRDSFSFYGIHIPKPEVADTTVCQDSPAPILATTDSNLVWFTQVSGGVGKSTQPPINTSQEGTKTLYVAIYKDGCVGKRVPVNVVVKAGPEEHFRPEAEMRCIDDKKTLIHLGTDEGSDVEYLWSTGDTTCCIATADVGLFVRVRSNSCGVAADTFQIVSEQCEDCLSFPTAFSPNNDGRNDRFRPMLRCTVKDFQWRICNRWGNTVFFSGNTSDYWDGSFKGTPAMAGIYMYYATFTSTLTGMKFVVKGEVTLLR